MLYSLICKPHIAKTDFFVYFCTRFINIFQVRLHIFNPEHDMALAYNKPEITLPHNIQEFKMNLGYIPALWAEDGDCILVDDIQFAVKALKRTGRPHSDILFLEKEDLKDGHFTEILPWGWDINIHSTLRTSGINEKVLPTKHILFTIRELSNRKQTKYLLKYLHKYINNDICGESFHIDNTSDFKYISKDFENIVVKAPWSSSGRGIRYISPKNICKSTEGWVENIIAKQGGIMIEPYYNKVKDFAMEFFSDGNGQINYCGLSLFETDKGSYIGNIIAKEEIKRKQIEKFISNNLLNKTISALKNYFSVLFSGTYKGPFGIDMMIVAKNDNNGFLLHPCVEINLRETMGHLANKLFKEVDNREEIMKITHDVNYKIKFEYTDRKFVKTI